MEGDYRGGRDGRRGSWWNEGGMPSDIHRRLSAVFGDNAPTYGTLFNCVRGCKQRQGTVIDGCAWAISQHSKTMVPWSHTEAPNVMGAICRTRRDNVVLEDF